MISPGGVVFHLKHALPLLGAVLSCVAVTFKVQAQQVIHSCTAASIIIRLGKASAMGQTWPKWPPNDIKTCLIRDRVSAHSTGGFPRIMIMR